MHNVGIFLHGKSLATYLLLSFLHPIHLVLYYILNKAAILDQLFMCLNPAATSSYVGHDFFFFFTDNERKKCLKTVYPLMSL